MTSERRRENNKIVEKGIKKMRREIKLKRERGKQNIVRNVKKKRMACFL